MRATLGLQGLLSTFPVCLYPWPRLHHPWRKGERAVELPTQGSLMAWATLDNTLGASAAGRHCAIRKQTAQLANSLARQEAEGGLQTAEGGLQSRQKSGLLEVVLPEARATDWPGLSGPNPEQSPQESRWPLVSGFPRVELTGRGGSRSLQRGAASAAACGHVRPCTAPAGPFRARGAGQEDLEAGVTHVAPLQLSARNLSTL